MQEGGVGRDRLKTTVDASGVSMPASVVALPPVTSSKPLMAPKKPAPGPCVFGSTARSIEYFTSEATTSRPFENFTPLRSLNV
jgi:hypothetical protein